jgi:hypothetical protein
MRWSVIAALCATPLHAQIVEVRVRDETARAPLAGAILRLVDDTGGTVLGLTDPAGRATLRPAAAGAYRLWVDRIGHRGHETPVFSLSRGQVLRLDLPLDLPRIQAGAPTPEVWCGREPPPGSAAAILWDEARKALAAVLATQQTGLARVRVTTFERDLDTDGTEVVERGIHSVITFGPPFLAPPADRVMRQGFVTLAPDSTEYVVPDATLLLSPVFARTRCMHTVPVDRAPPGLLGLALDPATGRPGPDIQATLWLDRATLELRRVEFAYVDVPGLSPEITAGGAVTLRRLASGAWIIGDWQTTLPRIVERSSPEWPGLRVREVAGYYVRGGRVIPLGELPEPAVPSSIVRGAVFDSLAGRGLAGAVVRVVGMADSTVTDSAGRFRLEVPARGQRDLAISHPRLGLVADGSHQPVDLQPGEEVTVRAAVPGVARFAAVLCGQAAGRAGVVGLAWRDGGPAEGLRVRVTWPATGEPRETGTGARGVFAVCSLPPDTDVRLQVLEGGAVVAERVVRMPAAGFVWVEPGR